MSPDAAFACQGLASAADKAVLTNRSYSINAALKAPVAVSAALAKAGRGAFHMMDESDDLPSLAMIIPLGLLTLCTIWAMISPL